jgi:hypothetical protein
LKSEVVRFAVQCYYLDMRWQHIAYALVTAAVGAATFTTIIDLSQHTVALWH